MPAAIACPKCKKQYNLPDNLLGKPVKCTACQTTFKTPAPQGQQRATRRPTASAEEIAARKKAQIQAQQQAAELKKMVM